MNRRGFLGSILALGAAPAIVRAESLMRIIAPSQELTFFSAELTLTIDEYAAAYAGPTPTLSEIITQTLISRSAMLARNIERSNTLLREMKKSEWRHTSGSRILIRE